VERLDVEGGRVKSLALTTGETVTANVVLSSAGFAETMRLIDGAPRASNTDNSIGQVTFVETIAVLDRPPAELGHSATIVFGNDSREFDYSRPDEPVDLRSRIVCCPSNYEGHEELPDPAFRMTWLANYEGWHGLDDATYAEQKNRCFERFLEQGEPFIPNLRSHVVFWDMFTPRTIWHYTGHLNGAVYGSPVKRRDGRTPYSNLFLCGTDQGYLGIVGAMLSGIMMANQHALQSA